MSAEPLEKVIVNRILKKLNELPECRAIKTHGGAFGHSGQPDITGCIRGRRFDLECKRPGGKATPKQESEMRKWREAGAICGVVTSWEEAKCILTLNEYEVHDE